MVLGSLDPQERGRGQGVRLLVEAGIDTISVTPDTVSVFDRSGLWEQREKAGVMQANIIWNVAKSTESPSANNGPPA